MVALVAERFPAAPSRTPTIPSRPKTNAPSVPRGTPIAKLALVKMKQKGPVDVRGMRRARVAMQAWIVDEAFTARGYALDLSEGGAKVGGVGTRVPVGARVLLKLKLTPNAIPIVMRAQVVRYDFTEGLPTCALRFLEMAWDDAFDLSRALDHARALDDTTRR